MCASTKAAAQNAGLVLYITQDRNATCFSSCGTQMQVQKTQFKTPACIVAIRYDITSILKSGINLGPVAKFRWSAWLGAPQAGPALWNYPVPPYSRYKYYTPERQCVTCVTNFWILIISIHTSRFGNRIKQIWQPLLFMNGYLRMEYTLFQDFACKIQRPAPPTGHPGRAQSGRTPEFGYGPLIDIKYGFPPTDR